MRDRQVGLRDKKSQHARWAGLGDQQRARAGLRVVVESHGGHFWSTQGQAQRPLDVVSLRIDVQERMTLQLADALISPTHYMSAFLRQRGWRLPATSLVVPNVLPELEAAAAERLVRPPGPRLRAQFAAEARTPHGLWSSRGGAGRHGTHS